MHGGRFTCKVTMDREVDEDGICAFSLFWAFLSGVKFNDLSQFNTIT